jgi:phage gp36-like protein
MAYAVQSDLLLRVTAQELVALTDDAKSGQANAGTISGALDEATAEIENYCRGRYQTPLQASNTVTRLCRDIAIYLLYSRRPQKMNDTVRQRYEDAIALLKDVSTGKAQLDQPSGATTPQTMTSGAALPTCSHLRFTEHDIKGFV